MLTKDQILKLDGALPMDEDVQVVTVSEAEWERVALQVMRDYELEMELLK